MTTCYRPRFPVAAYGSRSRRGPRSLSTVLWPAFEKSHVSLQTKNEKERRKNRDSSSDSRQSGLEIALTNYICTQHLMHAYSFLNDRSAILACVRGRIDVVGIRPNRFVPHENEDVPSRGNSFHQLSVRGTVAVH